VFFAKLAGICDRTEVVVENYLLVHGKLIDVLDVIFVKN
jgi:hypothetical protein